MTRSGIIPIDRVRPRARTLDRLVRVLSSGGLAVIPTETQYALAAVATNQHAVAAVRALKARGSKPFSIFVRDYAMLRNLGIPVPPLAGALSLVYWPGPLTLILPTHTPTLRRLGSGRASVGVRLSSEPLIDSLLARLQLPLIATSANPSGTVMSVTQENRWLARLTASGSVVWARPAQYRQRSASTVIDVSGKNPRQLRAGAISESEWRSVLYN